MTLGNIFEKAAPNGAAVAFDILTLNEGQVASVCGRDKLYYLKSGATLNSVDSADGRRWVTGLYLSGEYFLEECDGINSRSACALCPTSIYAFTLDDPVSSKMVLDFCPSIIDVRNRIKEDSLRLGFMLARAYAVEKLAYFLVDLSRRLGEPETFAIPITRYEIGDYLGLTSETVTRTFTALKDKGAIAVNGKLVTILRRDLLDHASAEIMSL